MNMEDKSFPPKAGSHNSNVVADYKGHEEIPGEDPLAQKFNLPQSLAEDLQTLSDLEGTSKTNIVRKALYDYFSFSHIWNNKRLFLKPKGGEQRQISRDVLAKEGDGTRVSVMWCTNEDDPREKCFFVACRVVGLKKNTVVINPVFYLYHPTEEASLEKSDVIKPEFYEFDPSLRSQVPFLNNLKYEIEFQYIWAILPN